MNTVSTFLKRVAGELAVLALSLAAAGGLARLLVPARPARAAVSNEFYNRLSLSLMVCFIVWIAAYYTLHKLYDRWRAGHRGGAERRPHNPPLERTGTSGIL